MVDNWVIVFLNLGLLRVFLFALFDDFFGRLMCCFKILVFGIIVNF